MSINRYIAVLLSLLLLFALAACHTDGGAGETSVSDSQSESVVPTETTEDISKTEIPESTSESVTETDPIAETKPIIETEDNETIESEITQSMELNRYIRSLTKFFYEPCDKLNSKAFRDDILCLLFSFSYNYGEQLGFAAWDEARADETLLVIQGEDLRKVGKMLLGDDFDAWDYHDTLDWGEYIEETDTYEVSFGTDYWGGELVEIVFGTQPAITEIADGAEVVVALRFYDVRYMLLANEEDYDMPDSQPAFFLRYTFQSVVSDGFRYYRLIRISNVVS